MPVLQVADWLCHSADCYVVDFLKLLIESVIKSCISWLEFLLKLKLEHNALCRGQVFLFLAGIDRMILYDTVGIFLNYFTVYLRLSRYNNQSLVMKCYDLHPLNAGNLAFMLQESSLPLCIGHKTMYNRAPSTGQSDML